MGNGRGGGVFVACYCLYFLFPTGVGAHTHKHTHAASTRASVVTFWPEVCRTVGRGKSLLPEPSSAAGLCLQERLSAEEAASCSSQYGQETPSNHAHGRRGRPAA